MRTCPKRGDVTVLVLGVLLLLDLTGVISGDKLKDRFFNDSKQKTQVVALTKDLQDAKAAQAKAADAQAAADDARTRKEHLQHENVHGAVLALANEKNPSIPVQVAAVFATNADNSFDPLAPSEIAQVTDLVGKLVSQNAADRAAANVELQTLEGQLSQAKAQQAQLETQLAVEKATSSSLLDKTVADSKSLAAWAADNASLVQRLKSFVIWASVFAGLFFLVFHVLPALAKFYPPLAPFAKALSGLVAFPLHALHAAETAAADAAHAVTQASLATTQAQLASVQAAHAATQAALVTAVSAK